MKQTICVFGLMAAATIPMAAQPKGNIRSTTRIVVKPDRMGDFTAAVKEFGAVVKKANWERRYTVWRSQSGPAEFLLSMYSEKWADLDIMQDPKLKEVSASLTGIGSRISACEEKSERIIAEVLPEVSLPRTGTPPKMIRVLRTRVKPERIDDYLATLKSDLFPAVRKGEVRVFAVARARYGAPLNEFISTIGMESWADLDTMSPISRGLGGQEAYQAFLKKLAPMQDSSQWDVYRFQPDLSYLAQ
jgi:hypothetical protein